MPEPGLSNGRQHPRRADLAGRPERAYTRQVVLFPVPVTMLRCCWLPEDFHTHAAQRVRRVPSAENPCLAIYPSLVLASY